MNILHHKSWHVRNRNNIERVKRDEAKAAEEEKEKERKRSLAEQEARTNYLRNQARLRGSEPAATLVPKESRHINFFAEAEAGLKGKEVNEEHEKEKKEEKEAYEKKIGLLTYIGQSAVESQTTKPWYFNPKTQKRTRDSSSDSEADEKRKDFLDPMKAVEKHVKTYKREKKKKKKKKHKRSSPSPPPSKKKSIEELRAERLRREATEKQKVKKLFGELRGEKPKDDIIMDDRERRYNSQFNPDFVRRPKKRYEPQY
ncbi:DgyrCDS5726 [Dimorphilus gyrociliatus]|uniref:DgyrCDS5726 n=1 Tax=Dimorphilus gyrociliatus TaxID=2664684 RepID=A0A7I8VNG9_9ANNE|nr:DgyrCDS5726 [Dimorphilus gyrociliatus]